jgi:hypothetical protein
LSRGLRPTLLARFAALGAGSFTSGATVVAIIGQSWRCGGREQRDQE